MKYDEYPSVKEVKCTEDYVLFITFSNGVSKKMDMAHLINSKDCYSPLKNKALFLQGKKLGKWAVSWNDEVDIAAEYIFDNGTDD